MKTSMITIFIQRRPGSGRGLQEDLKAGIRMAVLALRMFRFRNSCRKLKTGQEPKAISLLRACQGFTMDMKRWAGYGPIDQPTVSSS